MSASIVGVLGPLQNASFSLQDELTIGRDSSNRICIEDYSVSRRHCLIVSDHDRFLIRDLGSHNGTFVNGAPIDECVLAHGDRIAVGGSVFEFSLDHQNQAPNPATVSFEEMSPIGTTSEIIGSSAFTDEGILTASMPKERLSRDFAALLLIATRLRGIRNSESLLWQLTGVLLEIVPAERVAILLGNNPSSLEPVFAWDKVSGPGKTVRVSRTVVLKVAAERKALVINNVPEQSPSVSLKELEIQSVLCVPLCTPDKLLGVIYIDNRQIGSIFDAGHLHLMSAVATMAALALENTLALEQLERENQQLKADGQSQFDMIGDCDAMQALYRFIAKVAPSDSNVLIYGESGTGKELVARAIHRHSRRTEKTFIAINCAAITETLLESELFGYEKGAFTGAVGQKRGYLEAADGGTIFLDEIGELALSLQAKLLRVLQEREVIRVGGTRPTKVDIRVIAATNRTLGDLVKQGAFRDDLYYRLNVVSCHIAPLRMRREDIPILARHFADKYGAKCNRPIRGISDEAIACLTHYDWPGNVRELENAIERAVVLGSTGQILRDDLPESLTESSSTLDGSSADYHVEIARKKKELILHALEQVDGNFTDAAKLLGIHPNYLHRLVRVLDLRPEIKKAGK